MRPVVNLWLKCAMRDHTFQHDPRLAQSPFPPVGQPCTGSLRCISSW